MDEIELKLQVPPQQRGKITNALSGDAPVRRVRLQACYQDTAERLLASHGLALRLRREGRQWVQTLKGASDDGMTRLEHNVPRGGAAAMPEVEPSLHAGTAGGERLIALLRDDSGGTLQTLYRTDIRRLRRTHLVRAPGRPGAKVELAFDEGKIMAGEAAIGVCELEIELLSGSPLAVIDTARRWISRHGLWLDGRSKAERGDLLSRGLVMSPPCQATPLVLPSQTGAAAAWQAVLRNCGNQVLANASQIASGEHAPEHVHQLRVGLRRLRSAIAFFEHDDTALATGAATLFRALGAARDQVVTEGEFGADLATAMRSAGLPSGSGPRPAGAAPMCDLALRTAESQTFLLDLLAAMHVQASPEETSPAREHLAARLELWHRQVVRGVKHYGALDDESRHRLRRRAKRLRYATEFCGSLFSKKPVRRYLKALRALQERLGKVSDVVMAMEVFRARAGSEERAMFALGWLTARREVMIAESARELKSFARTEPFWQAD